MQHDDVFAPYNQRSLADKADFPEIQIAIAGTALTFRDYRVADRAFTEAVRLDPQRIEAWTMIARLRAAQGNIKGAVNALSEGLAANPNELGLTKLLEDVTRSKRLK